MAQVTLSVGGYQYQIACRDGEEPRLLQLGEIVDAKVLEARGAVGNASEVRQLLLASLLFADDALEAGKGIPSAPPMTAPRPDDARLAETLEALATRIEDVASSLENIGTSA